MIAPLPRPPAIASAGEYEQWLAEDPTPDLQAFVRQHGDWRRLPPDVAERMADWQARRRLRSGSAP